jgi:hypothetical protein
MKKGQSMVTDPFGFRVIILDESCFTNEVTSDPEIYNGFQTVIERPAFIIVLPDNSPAERYYYRSIGWTKTVLIRVQKKDENWEANECVFDPSDALIKQLAAQGRIVAIELPDPL